MSPLQILLFLFDLYIAIMLLRFVLQLTRADFYNPLSQFVVRMTQPLLAPLRRIIPGLGGIDWSSLLVAVLLMALKLTLGAWAALAKPGIVLDILRLTLFEMLLLVLQLAFWGVILRAVLSWVDPYSANPIARVLAQLTDPMLKPVRRFIPPIGGLDLSPMFLTLAILLLQWLVRNLELGVWF